MTVLLARNGFATLAQSWALGLLDAAGEGGQAADEVFAEMTGCPAFAELCDTLVLSRGEAGLVALLFAAGHSPEVVTAIRHHSPHSEARGVPSWLALRVVPGASAEDLAGGATLQLMACIEVEQGVLPIEAHVRMAPALAERLTGVRPLDPLVATHTAPLPAAAGEAEEADAGQLARALSLRDAGGMSPLVLAGTDDAESVATVLGALGLAASRLFAEDIPDSQAQRDRLARCWSREAALDGRVLVIVAGNGVPESRVTDFVDRVMGHVVLVGEMPGIAPRRGVSLHLAQRRSDAAPARRWQAALGPQRTAKVGPRLEAIAQQFALRPSEIVALCRDVGPQIDGAKDPPEAARLLWHDAARVVGPENVPGVELVEPAYRWTDIVLPVPVEQRLRRIEGHVRHSGLVMDEWGFAGRMGGRGRGISVLLSGQSGTGKSMAAEVLASALDLRVMFIDLSQLISKFIGDTPKNVAAAFRLAERSGAVMVWNEGDAIWGARGTVGNATDRHVNAEVGDLLQRIENFRGFTIITTNMRHAIDDAFTRRFRFCLNFPVPSERERLLLWEKAFPEAAPLGDIDWAALSHLQLTGGSIRNIALAAAFHAAELGQEINREIIAAEVIEEFRKQDRAAPAIEWSSSA